MNQTATKSRESARASTPHTGAAGAAETHRSTGEQQHDPARDRGFGFWWLVATLGVAVALGMVVALLLTPIAGLIAFLVVGIWALVRRRRRKPDDRDNRTARASVRRSQQPSGTPGRTAADAPASAAA